MSLLSEKIQKELQEKPEPPVELTLEGEFTWLTEICGKELLVTDFAWRSTGLPSFPRMVEIQVQVDGQTYVVLTTTSYCKWVFRQITPAHLPFLATFLYFPERDRGRHFLIV